MLRSGFLKHVQYPQNGIWFDHEFGGGFYQTKDAWHVFFGNIHLISTSHQQDNLSKAWDNKNILKQWVLHSGNLT